MLGICLVGAGGIAIQHIKAFTQIGGVRHRWVVSREENEALTFAHHWQFEKSGIHLEEALSDPQVDLVVISSPSNLHARQTLAALRAGKDVIVEIPVALNLTDAEEITSYAAQVGRRVQVCHTMRSFPAIREARRRARTGELQISQVAGYFAIPRRRNQSWAGQRHWIDNLLWHHGCHQVDAALWVLGTREIQQVGALVGKAHPQFGMAMDVALVFRTASRQLVTQSLTYNTEQFHWELRFIGDEDVLTFRNGQCFDERDKPIIAEVDIRDLVAQNSQMLAALRNHEPSDYDVEEVLQAMQVLHQAQNAAGGLA
jgi:2-hydroxy-4-carboxymuconate semialdehyde hemiacetal dehydrogenase